MSLPIAPIDPECDVIVTAEADAEMRVNRPLLPGLYIVATPIGNLGDITRRACDILGAADLVVVEDSRVTGKLLHHLGIKARMRPYHDHSDARDRDDIVAAARMGVVALVSDAGTPLISDPGYKLVRSAHESGVMVTTAPGACAAIAALTLSGLPSDRFVFEGFLPAKAMARRRVMEELAAFPATRIFYESGPRLGAMLGEAAAVFGGDTDGAVVREITKKFEEVARGTLADLAARYADEAPRGEIVVLIAPSAPVAEVLNQDAIDAHILAALADMKVGQAATHLAGTLGLDRKTLYNRALELKAELKGK